jgi:type II secretory pathway component PulF
MTDQDRMLINFIGPVITLGLGLFIGFTVVALYLPIFSLGDALTG